MKWSDLMWRDTFAGAQQSRLSFGTQYELSIVTELNEPDLYECAIFSGDDFAILPGIHPEGDDDFLDETLRFQTRIEVIGIIRKLESITGKSPLNVYN